MPLPKPKAGETRKNFNSRCMGNPTMNTEYPKQDQRYAVCNSLFDKGNKEMKTEKKIKRIKLMKVGKTKDIQEAFDNPFQEVGESQVDSENRIIKRTCIFGRAKSANGYTYKDEAITKINQLAGEGVKCYINHPSKTETKDRDGVRDLRDWIGVYKNPVKEGEKIFADLYCRESYWDLVKDVALLQPHGVGNSINARVAMVRNAQTGEEAVVDVDQLRSVDLVASAATTQNLFESNINENIPEERILFDRDMIERKISTKFEIMAKEEGVIQDKLNNNKIKMAISDLSFTANNMIEDVLYDDKKSVGDKKKAVMAIFDDLDKEVKKKLGEIKEQIGGLQMDLTLEAVKNNAEIMEALRNEFNKEKKVETFEAQITELKESVSDLTKKVETLEGEKTSLTEENDNLKKDLEEANAELDKKMVAEKLAEKKELMHTLIKESDLPEDAVTDTFKRLLMGVKESKDDEGNEISVEDGMKQLIEDRKILVNKESGKVKGSGDEYDEKKEQKKEKKTSPLLNGETAKDIAESIGKNIKAKR